MKKICTPCKTFVSITKRIIVFIILTVLAGASYGQSQKAIAKLIKESHPINDSIVAEAYALYLHEKINWLSADVFLASHSTENSIGNVVVVDNDHLCAVYADSNRQCVFEYRVDLVTFEVEMLDTTRPLKDF